jgi:hypothetical protein
MVASYKVGLFPQQQQAIDFTWLAMIIAFSKLQTLQIKQAI